MYTLAPMIRRGDNLFGLMNQLERSVFGNGAALPSAFRTDIRDAGDRYVLEAELPGFSKEEISLDLKDNVLTISGSRDEENEEKDDKGGYLRRERRYGSLSRSFDLSEIDEEAISATYENGILKVELPKLVPAEPESRKIEIR